MDTHVLNTQFIYYRMRWKLKSWIPNLLNTELHGYSSPEYPTYLILKHMDTQVLNTQLI